MTDLQQQLSAGRPVSLQVPRDIDGVIAALAQPVVPALRRAASRLQRLTASDLAAIESTARLQLAQLITTLRAEYAGLAERAEAERAVSEAIDMPQAMRVSVYGARGTAKPGALS